ncbi:30S ribosomal protein S15 [Candidatus Saccharibacteria bacterium]|nr:30S ribosomal protein S15 [Candidatus Saccharibacteria bacterium]
MITAENKANAIAAVQKSKQDVGSAEVQVSVLTARIKEITEHLRVHKQDHKARRGLIQMVGKRKRLLSYLERKDFAGYKALITHLGLRK